MTSIIRNDTNGIGIKIPIEKEQTLNTIVTDLKSVEGIVAIALGGSYATGDATETSDLDIGLYYSPKNPFNIDEIRSIARKYAVDEPTTQVIAKLKAEVQVYPPKLKETVIQYSLWSLEFTLWHAELFCKKQDIYNTMGFTLKE